MRSRARRVKERLRLSYIILFPSLIREGDKGGGLLSNYLGGEVVKLSPIRRQ